MPRYGITQSLLGAWLYTFDCMEGYEDEAMNDFLATLRKEQKAPTEAIINGCNFENEVYKVSNHLPRVEHSKWEKGIQAVAERIMDAPVQVHVWKEFTVDGVDFLLHGVIDALQAGHIYDVKFMNSSMGSKEVYGKYLNSPQHPAYLFALPEAMDFTYLLSDGEDLYTETYTREMTRPFPDIVHDFISWLKNVGLWQTYIDNWQDDRRA